MILYIDRAWLLDLAHRSLPGDPDVTDFGTLQAAVARHADKVMDRPVHPEVHHRAAALMHQLIRVPALEHANELFGAVVAASYLTVSGVVVTADFKQAGDLAERIARNGLDVRMVAEEIKGWAGRG
ncbi:fic family toxin-antitoxin system, toxin component [Streptomyces rishiriensis]|uniref:Prophage maintenance system killer protein n=1 Tax=Streptomyces rishiriensis TaxID=68264 RepID=A0ABU0NHY2_STRRH|nr:fic family toxin-antitoxin system, toxin component [Streptomyces rishiriensis]MDQ0578736.1 prophage maintenance system killer protein [Streptomyces rishiriensis]